MRQRRGLILLRRLMRYSSGLCEGQLALVGSFLVGLCCHNLRTTAAQVRFGGSAAVGIFLDSGLWNTFVVHLFERIHRGGVWATALPLSEHSIGERAFHRLGSGVQISSRWGSVRGALSLALLFEGVGVVLLNLIGMGLLLSVVSLFV